MATNNNYWLLAGHVKSAAGSISTLFKNGVGPLGQHDNEGVVSSAVFCTELRHFLTYNKMQPAKNQIIIQHSSAVYVGMVVVVCILYYKQKVALLLNRTENRQTKLPMKKRGLNSSCS